MIKAFLFIISIVTSEDQLVTRVIEVEACPAKEAFTAGMADLQAQGKLKQWQAYCYKLPVAGQGV